MALAVIGKVNKKYPQCRYILESLPPIMTPSNIDFNQKVQQERSSSLGRQINSGHTQGSFVYFQGDSGSARRIYSTTQNHLNLSKASTSTKQSLSISSKNTGPLRNSSLNQHINESNIRNSKRSNNNSNLSGSYNKRIGNTTISNPYQASINSATNLKTNDRMITSQRFQQKFQKRIQEKKSKNQGNCKKRKIQFLQQNFNNMTLDQRRDLSAGNRGNPKNLNGLMVMLNQQHHNQVPDNLNLGTIQSNRSFRIQRMNNNNSISPRDSSVESDLSIKSITLGGRLQNSINRRLAGGKNKRKDFIIEPKPPQRARDQSVQSSRSYRASRSFRAESIHSERGDVDENDTATKKNRQKKSDILTLGQNVLIDGESSMESNSLAKIQQIEALNKRVSHAENLAGKYKSQLDKARQVLRIFKQKLNKMNVQGQSKKAKIQNQIQKLEKKQLSQRPSSASNIYNNITIYANNSVNNSISINSSANQENNSKEPTTIEELKKALKAKDQLLKKTTKALQSAKQKQQVLLKQIIELNKEKAQLKSLKLVD